MADAARNRRDEEEIRTRTGDEEATTHEADGVDGEQRRRLREFLRKGVIPQAGEKGTEGDEEA